MQESIKVKFKKLSENAVIPYKTHDSDFCYDCVATSEEEIAPGVWKYGLGFSLETDMSSAIYFYGDIMRFSFDLRPRSSIWKTGMVLSNSVGTVDMDYRGEVSAVFYHVAQGMPRYKVGDRVCQIKFGITPPLKFEESNCLSETERGDGGYGSTGK